MTRKWSSRNKSPKHSGVGIRHQSHDIVEQAAALSKEWDTSPQKQDLLDTIKDVILSQDGFSVDCALCLGLGSMETARLKPLPAWKGVLGRRDDDGGGELEEQELTTLKPVGNAEERNPSLYQLLVFETALESLRERFLIGSVLFQDPSFTDADREFLQNRGHTVVDWDTSLPEVNGSYAMDLSLLKLTTGSTMCYLPFLDTDIIVEAVCWIRPSLYLGMNLVATTVSGMLYHSEISKDLMDSYSDIVISSDFRSIAAFGGEEPGDFGFMWPVNATGSQEITAKLERRNERILNTALDFETEIYKGIAQMKLERRKPRKI